MAQAAATVIGDDATIELVETAHKPMRRAIKYELALLESERQGAV